MVTVVGAGVGNIVEDIVSGETESFGCGQQPLWAEGALGVDEEALALRASHVDRQLTGNRHRVHQLRFTRPEMQN